jgi:hypothetical protein
MTFCYMVKGREINWKAYLLISGWNLNVTWNEKKNIFGISNPIELEGNEIFSVKMNGKEFDRDEEIKKKKIRSRHTRDQTEHIWKNKTENTKKKKNKKQKKNYIWLVSRRWCGEVEMRKDKRNSSTTDSLTRHRPCVRMSSLSVDARSTSSQRWNMSRSDWSWSPSIRSADGPNIVNSRNWHILSTDVTSRWRIT